MREIEHGENVLAGGGAMVQVKTDHVTAVAVQKPRDLRRSIAALELEAELSGDTFFYAWGVGQNRIEGPSVKLALAAMRAYGNCAVQALPLQETPTAFIFNNVFIDVENGITLSRQFRQAKDWTVHGKLDEARKMDIRFQIGQSKNIRNLILNSVPAVLIDRAMEAAKSGVRSSIEKYIAQQDAKKAGSGLPAAREHIISSLMKSGGVSLERILSKLGIAKPEAIMIDELILLRADNEAIKSGEANPLELFPNPVPPTTGTLKDKMKAATPTGATPAGEGSEGSKPGKNPKPSGKGKNGAGLVEGEIPNEETGEPEREPGEDDLTAGI
jgi:hypothetical protein